jgi:hypothetical protein
MAPTATTQLFGAPCLKQQPALERWQGLRCSQRAGQQTKRGGASCIHVDPRGPAPARAPHPPLWLHASAECCVAPALRMVVRRGAPGGLPQCCCGGPAALLPAACSRRPLPCWLLLDGTVTAADDLQSWGRCRVLPSAAVFLAGASVFLCAYIHMALVMVSLLWRSYPEQGCDSLWSNCVATAGSRPHGFPRL